MKTPNGRFKTEQEIHLPKFSGSNWKPTYKASMFLQGVIDFMLSNEETIDTLPMIKEIICEMTNVSVVLNSSRADFAKIYNFFKEDLETEKKIATRTGTPIVQQRSALNHSELIQPTGQIHNIAYWNSKSTEIMDFLNKGLKIELSKFFNILESEVNLPDITILSFHLPSDPALRNIVLKKSSSESVWCKLRLNLSKWPNIKSNADFLKGLNSNARRDKVKAVTDKLFLTVMEIGYSQSIRFVFSEVDLSNSMASMRVVIGGIDGQGRSFPREKEVEELNLSNTQTSKRSLLFLYQLDNLRILNLDNCPELKHSGKDLFELIAQNGKVSNIESLSVVGISNYVAPDWLTPIDAGCPKLKKVFFTRQKGTKAIGWHDAILMQTMRDPVLLPCGHILDKESLLGQTLCSFDRKPFLEAELVLLNPSITLLEKGEDNQWVARIVDSLRTPLESKVLIHPSCGEFYNLSTLQKLYNIALGKRSVDEQVRTELKVKFLF
eukprot:TRINITY_DN3433_c0_g1_i1.p1 TRINITY_DN3433_c0_g1~~TRINITY_DN3433_c0_g1_i1.p1  ORF type:complete len:494 (-),score=59.35 TRINITY_DN3433_c0_g1_i1:66-1547(-)